MNIIKKYIYIRKHIFYVTLKMKNILIKKYRKYHTKKLI